MKIRELSDRTDTPASTLRYYEKIGLIPYTERESGQRVYAESMIWRINFINAAKSTGFELDEINTLFSKADASLDWRAIASTKLAEIEAKIDHFKKMQAGLEHILAHNCLDDGIQAFARADKKITI